MAHKDEKRIDARRAYIWDQQSVPVIALSIGVSEATVRRWKRDAKQSGDNWDVARAAHMMAGEGLETVVSGVVEQFVTLFKATIEQLQDDGNLSPEERVKAMASLSDAFNKMVASAGRVAPKISELGVANDVLQRQAEFIREFYPQHAAAFLEILEPFGERLVEVYG
nr:DUF1804 family protein [uncultured Cohaesibacter sp.]